MKFPCYKQLNISLCFLTIVLFMMSACSAAEQEAPSQQEPIAVGAQSVSKYIAALKNKKVALIINQTSTIGDQHLLDTLLALNINITRVFAPEHGFRGTADAGAHLDDMTDPETGIPVISLYGKNKKPSSDQLADIDVVVFDIQDVGVRFYTYLSTLHYVMEACAEYKTPLIVLDRPNPNGHYIDGPVMTSEVMSFVGLHPVPIVYGMTIGEYARMIKGEQWINDAENLKMKIIPCSHYDRNMPYDLPIKPSPNLPNNRSILLYPSLCLFEGTNISVGRGTDKQFQVVGHPALDNYAFSFTPTSQAGAKYPKHENKKCYGVDLSQINVDTLRQQGQLDFQLLLDMHAGLSNKNKSYFLKTNFFDKLAGTKDLRKQIEEGKSMSEIRSSWSEDLNTFKVMRKKYLIYK